MKKQISVLLAFLLCACSDNTPETPKGEPKNHSRAHYQVLSFDVHQDIVIAKPQPSFKQTPENLTRRSCQLLALCQRPLRYKALAEIISSPLAQNLEEGLEPIAAESCVFDVPSYKSLLALSHTQNALRNNTTDTTRARYKSALQQVRENIVYAWAFALWSNFNYTAVKTPLLAMMTETLAGSAPKNPDSPLVPTQDSITSPAEFGYAMAWVFRHTSGRFGSSINAIKALSQACVSFWSKERKTFAKNATMHPPNTITHHGIAQRMQDIASVHAYPHFWQNMAALIATPIAQNVRLSVPIQGTVPSRFESDVAVLHVGQKKFQKLLTIWPDIQQDLEALITAQNTWQNRSSESAAQTYHNALQDTREKIVSIWAWSQWERHNPTNITTACNAILKEIAPSAPQLVEGDTCENTFEDASVSSAKSFARAATKIFRNNSGPAGASTDMILAFVHTCHDVWNTRRREQWQKISASPPQAIAKNLIGMRGSEIVGLHQNPTLLSRLIALLRTPVAQNLGVSITPVQGRTKQLLRQGLWPSLEKDLSHLIAQQNLYQEKNISYQAYSQTLQRVREKLIYVWAFGYWKALNTASTPTPLRLMLHRENNTFMPKRPQDTHQDAHFGVVKTAKTFAADIVHFFRNSKHPEDVLITLAHACAYFWEKTSKKTKSTQFAPLYRSASSLEP